MIRVSISKPPTLFFKSSFTVVYCRRPRVCEGLGELAEPSAHPTASIVHGSLSPQAGTGDPDPPRFHRRIRNYLLSLSRCPLPPRRPRAIHYVGFFDG